MALTHWSFQVKEHGGKRFKVIFFIGDLTPNNIQYYPQIKNESRLFGDVVQDLSYFDAYRNLTLKGISAMQWVNNYCPGSYRVMKVSS